MKVQYNSLTMLLSSFMQEFCPISSYVYCIFAQITNNKFVVELSIGRCENPECRNITEYGGISRNMAE
jgi:hypothetical protein